ncbi:leucine-rich repeat transmembrane neuronal protein 2-like isoform X1 [Sitodiplosis mosellana]|uniref:leucine-rich repeat transmembrane neuronal protein 2-like isoform X1 n=1 Tax=Sitodiplosis mosellana TaxID=263140 RepID=UPI0024448F0F|nr:leucine-rich repeat transmembrane neuronal protein 2-like isoform X1 [Sitodiplosis mosellana]
MRKQNNSVLLLSWWIIVFGDCIGSNSANTEMLGCDFKSENKTLIWVYCDNRFGKPMCTSELLTHPNISNSNVKELRTVYCTASGFNETLLSQFPNLEKLDVRSYGFVDFNISKENQEHLNTLKILIASNNHLTKLSKDYLQPMIALTQIDLSHNKINSVDRFTSKNLNLINLAHNKIVKLSDDTFSELHLLENLDLSCNAIETISDQMFINKTNLKILLLQYNSINTFDCSVTFQKILTLNIANNQGILKCDQQLNNGDPKDASKIKAKHTATSSNTTTTSITVLNQTESVLSSKLKSESINNKSTTLNPSSKSESVSSTTEEMNTSPFETTTGPESTSDEKFEYVDFAIGFGSVLVVLLVALLIWVFVRRKKKVTIELKPINEENIYETVKNKPDDDFI